MIEINFAREILAIVRALLSLGMHTQPIYRIILSRLYYAAHHVGRALLRNVGLTPEEWRVNVHRRVLDELENRYTGTISRNALEALENLQRMRVRADYDLNTRIRQRNINRAINLFEGYFNECCHLFEVR